MNPLYQTLLISSPNSQLFDAKTHCLTKPQIINPLQFHQNQIPFRLFSGLVYFFSLLCFTSLHTQTHKSMATEEVIKPPSLPPYPQMIMAAMDALKDNEGLSKASISKYMEATYGDLPAGHTNLLTQHLNTMKQNGELVFVKNNYMKPGPDVPLKRGRGRPPKPKDDAALDGPGKPRGRPRKENDGAAEPVAKKVKSVDDIDEGGAKPRGRPRKIVEGQLEGVEAN